MPSRSKPDDPVPPVKSLTAIAKAADDCEACPPWLEAELTRVKPAVIVAMGATAVAALLGPKITIAGAKGKVCETPYGSVIVTRHPSSVLRMREQSERRAALKELADDLKAAAKLAAKKKETRIGTPRGTETRKHGDA